MNSFSTTIGTGVSGTLDSLTATSVTKLNEKVSVSIVFSLILQWGVLYTIQATLDMLQVVFYFDFFHTSLWDVVYHPFKFIFEFIFSTTWIYLTIIIIIATWINSRRLKWTKTFPKAPMSMKQYLKPKLVCCLYTFWYFLIGVFLANVYLKFLHRPNFTYGSQSPVTTVGKENIPVENVDERFSFILLSSGLGASIFYVIFASTCDYTIQFPMLETSTYMRFRSIIGGSHIREAVALTTRVLVVSYFFNIMAGSFFHYVVCLVKNTEVNNSKNAKLVSIFDYLDLELLFVKMLCQTLVIFTLKAAWITLEILLTLRTKFKIENKIPGAGNFVLSDILCSNAVYLRKLAFYDLKLLAEFEEYRMKTLFNLSHPGGNPKTWSAISKTCIQLIQNLTNGLNSFIDKVAGDRRTAEMTSLGQITRGQPGPRAKFVFSPDELSPNKARYRFSQAAMRNLNLPDDREFDRRRVDGSQDQILAFWFNPFASIFKLTNYYATQFTSYTGKLFSAMNFWIYTEDKEADIANMFQDYEMVLWAVNTLTDIVVASNKVDDKGVVQKDIRLILTTLVDFCIALDNFRGVREQLELEQGVKGQQKTRVPNSYVRNLVRGIRMPLKNEIMRIHFNCQHYYTVLSVPTYCEDKLRKLCYE